MKYSDSDTVLLHIYHKNDATDYEDKDQLSTFRKIVLMMKSIQIKAFALQQR